MRILQIHTDLRSGGIEAIVTGLCNEMIKRHELSFCSIYEPNEHDAFFQILDKRISVFTTHKKTPGGNVKYLWKIYRIIAKGNYDIVNMHGCFYYYMLSIFLLHNKISFFYTVHSDAKRENVRWDMKLFGLKSWCFKKNWIHPITISLESQRSFFELYKLPSRMIYNGAPIPNVRYVDMSKYRITSNTKILFHPGRITEAKNQCMLCKVCSRLQREGYDIVLLLAGTKQDENIYTNLQKYFSDRIQYLGERKDIVSMLSVSDALCLSSIWEGMPVVLLEAISVGCIPVCTPVGGVPEVIRNGENGFLAKSIDEEDYYIALKQFLNSDRNTIDRMKNRCLESFKTFNMENVALKYEEYYSEILSRK